MSSPKKPVGPKGAQYPIEGSLAAGTASIERSSVSFSSTNNNPAMESTLGSDLLGFLVELGMTEYMCCCGRLSSGVTTSFGKSGEQVIGKASCRVCSHVPCSAGHITPKGDWVEQLHSDQIQLERGTAAKYLYVCGCGTLNFVKVEAGSWWKLRHSDTALVSFSGNKCNCCTKAYAAGFLKLKVRKARTSRCSPNLTINTSRTIEETPKEIEATEDELQDDMEDELKGGVPLTGQFFPQGWSDLPTPFLTSINPLAFPTELLLPGPPNTHTEPIMSKDTNSEELTLPSELLTAHQAGSLSIASPNSLVHGDDEAEQEDPISDSREKPQRQHHSHATPWPVEGTQPALSDYLQYYAGIVNSTNTQFSHPNNSDVSSIQNLPPPTLLAPDDPLRGSGGIINHPEAWEIPLPPSPTSPSSSISTHTDLNSPQLKGY